MRKFKTEKEALKYAEKAIHKNGSEIVEIASRKTWLSATSIPLEKRFREPIETAVQNFFNEMDINDEDTVLYIGAQVSEILIKKIEENSPLKISCAYQNY